MPLDNDVYDVDYIIDSGRLEIEFSQDLNNLEYTVDYYDTTIGTALPYESGLWYWDKSPDFGWSGGGPPNSYQVLKIEVEDYSLIGQQQTVLVVLNDKASSYQATFSFEVTYKNPCLKGLRNIPTDN